MKVYVNWDVDSAYADDLPDAVDVPDYLEEDEIADWLSDEYGWCINSFYYA